MPVEPAARPPETGPSLARIQQEILEVARDFGLDPLPTIFEPVEHDEMSEVAAFGGFPTRYPHWRFGMEFEELRKGYQYGLQKIYELVINNDPCYAYLMKSNSLVDQKMVIAHVYGHSDFFKRNLWFSQTNRHMINEMANHGTRLRRYRERHGEEGVEEFLSGALSLENLIDVHSVYSPHRRRRLFDFAPGEEESPDVPRFRSKEYMDRYINPREYRERMRQRIREEAEKKKHFPEEPTKDVLEFLLEYAPLENWQRDVLSIVREEAYYFAPQAMTKIMNEGWATYWHSKIMTERVLRDDEILDYADHHSATLGTRPGSLNPYKLGVELWRDIEDRWNRGRFGRDYEECDDYAKKQDWDLHLGQGREKIFEVRTIYNDVTFLDDFLTREFAERQNLFVFRRNAQTGQPEISDRDFAVVKAQLLHQLTNLGSPIIVVQDGNFRNRAELLLLHRHEGHDLDLEEARDTLRNVQRIWQRPVHIETVVEDQKKLLSFDGQNHSEEDPGSPGA